jgi:hypothetical protein
MTQQDQKHSSRTERQEAREHFWNTIVVPTARGLESFFWNLAWFTVVICLLFGTTCISRLVYHEDRQEQQTTDVAR